MQLPDFLRLASNGTIELTGHRIELWHVVYFYNQGFSPEMIVNQFPSLPLATVYKAIAFYLENQTDVDDYVTRASAAMEQERVHGETLNVDALRRRLAAKTGAGV